MQAFQTYTLETAPAPSRPALSALNAAFGRVPNVAAVMAGSPVLIGGLAALFQQVHGGNFTEPEIQTVLLTNAVANACAWAAAFHTKLALDSGLAPSDVDAIRAGRAPGPAPLAALSNLARTLIERRGALATDEIAAFADAGVAQAALLEVIAIVAASTMTNYTGNVARPALEDVLLPYAWPNNAR